MKNPAPKPNRRKPNVDTVDRVPNLAAGLKRALTETGWSERGLALAASLKADRLRNVNRGRSAALEGDAVDRVTEVLGTSAGVLTGAEPWPAGGLIPKPKSEKKTREPVSGSLAELAEDARQVARSAREAVQVAVAAAEAAERVADRAEAALAVPAPTDEEIFDRWGREAETAVTARPPSPAPAPTPEHGQPSPTLRRKAATKSAEAPPVQPEALPSAPKRDQLLVEGRLLAWREGDRIHFDLMDPVPKSIHRALQKFAGAAGRLMFRRDYVFADGWNHGHRFSLPVNPPAKRRMLGDPETHDGARSEKGR